MEPRRTRILTAPRRRGVHPVFATLMVLLGMVVMSGGGYVLGRYVIAKKMLKPSEVHDSRPDPIRILSPEEARSVARDEASPVWANGVKPEDIPKVEESTPATPRKRAKPNTTKPATTTPAPNTPTNTAAPTDTPTPATDAPATTPPASDGTADTTNVSPD